ncbi:probable membrane-associated kinase regulator 2 [Henckelia pumila]|uniref:probable membrane-associated kinase regulator 2 n=1 Tax=Henckelia pumila TaxID=405737 RepID=UPI003C6E939C
MEAFSLLNYWRSGGDGGGGGCPTSAVEQDSSSTPTIVTAAVSPCSSDGEEDGPYFDLEFTLPEDETDAEEDESTPKRSENDDPRTRRTEDGDKTEDGSRAEEGSEHENEGDPKFTVESSSILLNVSEETSYSAFPVSLLKSATKIRVLLLKFKRSRSEKSENDAETPKFQENQCTKTSGKFFAVKFKVEEVKAPLVSLFNRDNHSKEKQGKGMKNNEENLDLSGVSVSDDKKLIQKYLKMVKPLYIRVSKRYVEKLKFSGGQQSFSGSKGGGAASSPPRVAVEEEGVKSRIAPQVNGGLPVQAPGPKVVHKQLGKSRSASSAAVAASPPDRRDDSLLQVQDGIQDAILHCKRSFQRL